MKKTDTKTKLLIFGSTGSIGRHLVKQALEQGHIVTAFSRNPVSLGFSHENLKTIQGDVFDLQAVQKAMEGQEAVLCSLGAGREGKVRFEGTKHIVQAMEKAGIQRFICQSTLGIGDSWENLNFFWKYFMFKGLIRRAFEDHVLQEDFVKRSSLKWTIVRPGAFTDGNKTGRYRHGFPGSEKSTTLKIARADVADFMLKQVEDNTYLHKTPGLSY